MIVSPREMTPILRLDPGQRISCAASHISFVTPATRPARPMDVARQMVVPAASADRVVPSLQLKRPRGSRKYRGKIRGAALEAAKGAARQTVLR